MTSSRHIAVLLFSLVKQGHDSKQVVKHFAELAGRYRLAVDQDNLLRFLNYYLENTSKQSTLQVVSSHELKKDLLTKIAKMVGAKSESPHQVEIREDMIGGFCAEYDNHIYDATIKTQLNRLKKHLLA